MNSSKSTATFATTLASSDFSSAGISSRSENRQEGSSPMTGTPRDAKGLSAAMRRVASVRALSIMPVATSTPLVSPG